MSTSDLELSPAARARRRALANLARLAGASAALPLIASLTASRAIAQTGTAAPTAPAASPPALPPRPAPQPGTRLVLLGTHGGPGIEQNRAETSSAVVVDGVPYLVDCGYGSLRTLVGSTIGYQQLDTIFFTHLHDDHTSDLPALLSHQWTGGSKKTTTEVYGPPGTAKLVEATLGFLRTNVEIRTVDEGRTVDPATLFHGHDVPATAAPTRVFADERVTVTAVESMHFPAHATAKMSHRALAYRFDTKQRSIVFTGDTAYSENIVGVAKGADLFVCEVMAQSVYEQNIARAKQAEAAGNPVSIARHVAETHSTPGDVGRMAAKAQVKTVVLNHLLPGPRQPGGLDYALSNFIDGVRAEFAGEVIVGQDLMVL
jgi:ribonuclease BN (tRNA processing enzyme)